MQTQYVPEFINECILKLEDGINEKERIFDLLGIKPIAKDISDTNGQYIHLGVHFNRKKYKNRNVWLEKKELEKGLKKHQFYTFKSKLKDLDGDIDNLVTNHKRTAIEIVEKYYKKHYIAQDAKQANHRESVNIIKEHFCRDIPKQALNTILNITEEVKAVLMDRYYGKNIYDFQEASYSKAPWREEYISEEEFNDLQKKIFWVTHKKTVKKEKWSTYLKKFFKKNKLTIRKKTNSDGLIMYDYNSIEPNIDYKALYRNEVNQLPEYDWSDVNINNYNNTYLSDGMFERYMKKFNPEVYFLHQHEKIVQTLKKKL